MRTVQELTARRQAWLESLDRHAEGLAWCESHTRLADLVVETVVSPDTPVAVIATGGYGRRELSPYSDIDLTIVPVDEGMPNLDSLVRRLYRELHDAFAQFGLPLGYSFRLVSDAPGLDAKTRTGLLDMRFVAGDPRPFRPLATALTESFPAGDFALAKISERKNAIATTNDTPLVAEPDLKEGSGGLRDFHAANWLRLSIGERPLPPGAAYDAVLRARNLLHRVSGRNYDRLTRSRLAQIAERVGAEPGTYSEELTEARCQLSSEYGRALERIREARFELSPGVVAARGEIRVLPHTDAGIAALGLSIGIQLGLSVGDFPFAPSEEVAGPEALRAISSGEPTIRALDSAGLLSRLLPELTRLRNRLPQDAVHVYTVMEHTLRAVAEIDALPQDGFLGNLLGSIADRGKLVLAILLHDIGKVAGDENHAEYGASMVEEIGRRWHLGDALIADLTWLVREHLTMVRVVRVRDLDRPETIEEFAAIVGTPERLTLLTLLTYADICAVAPGVFTPALATFLRQLYERTMARLEAERPQAEGDLDTTRRRLVSRLKKAPVDEEATARFIQSMPADYLSGTSTELIALHLEYAARAAEGEPTVETHPRPDLGGTELTVVCQDSPGLLSRLLAVLYAHDVGILSIRARTASSSPPVVLDSIVGSFGGGPIPTTTLRSLSEGLRRVAKGEVDADDLLRAKGLDPDRRQGFLRWNYVPGNPGILEVRAPKGRGMPFRVSRLLASFGWNVVSARIGQWAGNAAAAFYVLGPGNVPLSPDEVAAAFDREAALPNSQR
ncbi:HD domain-containing protein [bacterium]|nr:MAG: HD domain-containing protein [bacterium]